MPNDPLLDASVQWRIDAGTIERQEPTYRDRVEGILSAGLATEVVCTISAGKEAEVFLAMYHGAPIAIKVYRLYRTSHRGGRPIKADVMGSRAAREFALLWLAWRGNARVPTPARRVENMFSMRYIGDETGPAPRLHDVRLNEAGSLLARVLEGVERLARAGVVHGDLSDFNILVHRDEPWFIDLSGGLRVDRTGVAPWRRLTQASDALRVGLTALQRYFRRYRLTIEVEETVERIVSKLDRHGVLR